MYNHKQIEKKWQDFWEQNKTYKVENPSLGELSRGYAKPKYYTLDMFPYPSGAGLHVGHPEGYTANDIVARYKHANGFNVLHPMGWDAFGLPAENYAIKTGTHPKITTEENIANFKKQIKALGFSYDWDREVDTTDPKYYKWTQWIFLKLFENGLAYEQDLPINYCPSCKTGLANEEVLNDFTCERCGTKVEKRKLRQWVLAITKYADRLLADVDKLDWPEGIKDMQRNWIGKSEGCEFEMKKATDETKSIRVYTTRIDTVFGMSYAVLAPDHSQVLDFITPEQKEVCLDYIEKAKQKSDQDRTAENKEKTGVFTGSYVVNPYNNEKVQLWIADYVLGNYGTGAVMAVPAHDERDFEFAKKYDLEIKQVIATYNRLTGDSTPKDGFPTRVKRCTTSIIKYPNEEKFLVEYFSNGEICLLGGQIDGNESPLDCAKREIEEESGLNDFKFIKQVGIMVGHGFKLRKSTNCKDPDYFYIAELNSLDGFKENLEEDGVTYKNEWWTKDEILNSKVMKSHHIDMFKMYLQGEKAYTDDGILMNSGEFDILSSSEARQKLTEYAEQNGFGSKKVNYKLRDWLFSRQRYWGEPIPLIHIELENLKKLPHVDFIEKATDNNLAYILKREVNIGENCDRVSCGCGHIRELVIGGKVISKIYDGIYTKIICDYNLPLELPEVQSYEPAGDGNSPLSKVDNFVNVKLADNLVGKRETNTMPQWGGSCWYYLRYMDPDNENMLVDREVEKYWGQVDSYVGGAEHAVLHLLYARFWHKFLFDIGVVSHDEPFYRLKNQGLILSYAYERKNGGLVAVDEVEEKDGQGELFGKDNREHPVVKYFEIKTGEELNKIISKMSKSLKNVVNPDDIVQEFGADSLRLYEMYMADFKDSAPWDSKNIIGVRRFLDRVNSIYTGELEKFAETDEKAMKTLHKTIKKVGEDIENYKFNTAIAGMMICINEGIPKDEKLQKEWKEKFLIILHPFAPHLAEELWERIKNENSFVIPAKAGIYENSNKYDLLDEANANNQSIDSGLNPEGRMEGQSSIFFASWPKYDSKFVIDDTITIGVQVLGKLRGEIEIAIDEEQDIVLKKARNNEAVKKWLEGKEIVKEIYVKGKIVNLVVK